MIQSKHEESKNEKNIYGFTFGFDGCTWCGRNGLLGSHNSSFSTDKASSKVESVNDSSADDFIGTAEGGIQVTATSWDNSCIVNLSKKQQRRAKLYFVNLY